MLKNKRILLILILAIALFLIPSICRAEDTFETIDGIVAKKVVDGYGGNIEFRFSNINLNEENNYTWGICTNTNSSAVEEWYPLGDFSQSQKLATITLTSSGKVGKILKEKNTAWLYIKDDTNNLFVVEALRVDLTLPLLKAFKIVENPDATTFRSFSIDSVYGIDSLHYNIQKITDENVVSAYKEAKIAGKDLSTITNLAAVGDAPATGWKVMDEVYSAINNFYIHNKPGESGIYYVWVKGKDTNSKMVYGYNIFGLDNESPIVSNIKVISPESGTYKTSQTVKIRVNFNETITGTTVPTLKIKFGDSAERVLTNGTIKDNYIEYSYNIQESDVGQLSTVDLTGGTIKDAYNNNVKLSCPIISGNTIKANVEGTNNNQTENQDTNTQTPSTTVTLSSITITKTPTRNTYLEGEKFDKAGMVITATYSDGTKKEITNYTISPSVALKTTDTKVVIYYTENGVTKTVEQKVTVTAKGTSNNTGNTNGTGSGTNNKDKDTTIKNDTKLPQTGVTLLSLTVIGLMVVAIISKVRYGKYKDI